MEWIRSGLFPGCVAGLWEKGRWQWRFVAGHALVVPVRLRMRWRTLFDVASLTKPLVTARRVLAGAGKDWDLNEPLSSFRMGKRVRLINLLNHTAGFRDWVPLYLIHNDPTERFFYLSEAPELRPHLRPEALYSCLDFQWLGLWLQRNGHFPQPGKNLIKNGKGRALFAPPRRLRHQIAGTELWRTYEKTKAAALGFETSHYSYDQHPNWGQVHDLNAFTLPRGVAGNAGLFADADGIVQLARWWCRPSDARRWHPRLPWEMASPDGSYGLGWQLGIPGLPETRDRWLFHSGFTGVCIAVEPVKQQIWIFLTNRIHPEVRDVPMNTLRRELFLASFSH